MKERGVIVHTAANRQGRAVCPGLMLELSKVVIVRSQQAAYADEAVRKEREVLHRCAEDRTGRQRVKTIVGLPAVSTETVMADINNLTANILIEVVGAGTDHTHIDRRVRNICRLNLSVGTEVRVSRKEIDA